MLAKIKLFGAMFLLLIGIVQAHYASSATYELNAFVGGGGDVTSTATYEEAYGIGQNTIGEINEHSKTYAIRYGIYYMNSSFTMPLEPSLAYLFYVKDYGMEWVTINWSTT